MVDDWRALNTAQTTMPPIRTIADVAWLDATEMLVLRSRRRGNRVRAVPGGTRCVTNHCGGRARGLGCRRARGTSPCADRDHRRPERPDLEGRRQSVADLPRQDQHHRLPRLSQSLHCPQIAERPPILTLPLQTQPVGFEHWLAAAGDLLLGARCHGCGQPWWGICRELSSEARQPTSVLHRPGSVPRRIPDDGYILDVRPDLAQADHRS